MRELRERKRRENIENIKITMKGQSYVKQEGKHQKKGVLLGSVGDEVKIQQDDGGRGGELPNLKDREQDSSS